MTYKGCIENEPAPTSPSDVQTECCWCYAQREGLSYSEARSKYKNLVKAKRGDRVQSFHEAMAYTQLTSSSFSATHAGPEQKSYEDIRRGFKRTLDQIRGDRKKHKRRTKLSNLNLDDVRLANKDQYLGICTFRWQDKSCFCVHWASWPKRTGKKLNIQKLTVYDMDSGDVLTTGRCLEGQVGAHNICAVANDEASAALRNSYDSQGKYLAFAIGGEYRDRRDRRGKHESYDGISLYGLKPLTQSWQNWSTLEFQKIKRFLKGDHPGQIEGRSKCTQHGVGFSEFDGQSALAWWNGEYWLYARSNPKESGHRSVQVCHGKTLETLGAFQMCTFTGVASGIAGYDIYFLHPYVLPNKKGMMALMSFVPADEFKSDAEPAGVYCTMTVDGIHWLKPYAAHKCEDYARRAYDLPVNGYLEFHADDGIAFIVHRNVPCRLPQNSNKKESIEQVSCRLPQYMCKIWSE